MRSTVVFKSNTPTVTPTRGGKDAYSTLLTTRGRLRKESGDRALSFAMISGQDSYILTCRFQSALESGLKVNGKVTVDGQEFTIASWKKIDQVNHWYEFRLNTQVLA